MEVPSDITIVEYELSLNHSISLALNEHMNVSWSCYNKTICYNSRELTKFLGIKLAANKCLPIYFTTYNIEHTKVHIVNYNKKPPKSGGKVRPKQPSVCPINWKSSPHYSKLYRFQNH